MVVDVLPFVLEGIAVLFIELPELSDGIVVLFELLDGLPVLSCVVVVVPLALVGVVTVVVPVPEVGVFTVVPPGVVTVVLFGVVVTVVPWVSSPWEKANGLLKVIKANNAHFITFDAFIKNLRLIEHPKSHYTLYEQWTID